jgi:RNA polymerase sigma-70 factor (ECF subfamily)
VGTESATERVRSEARLAEAAEAARSGDRDAFATLVEEVYPDLVAFARFVLGRAADAEDLVQDALLVAWQKIATLRSGRSFYFWVRKIVYHSALAHLRERGRLVALEDADLEPIRLVTRDIDITRMLALLTPQQRAVVHLSLVEGMTSSEIQAALGVSGLTIRIYRARALARMRKYLGVELR